MDYKHLIRFFLQKLKKDNIGAYAAQAALFIIMSAIPFLLVFLSLLRFTPVSESTVLSVIQMVLPGQIKITPMLINVVNEVYTNSAKMLPIAVIFAVYSAAKSIQSLRYGLNIVYDTDETRNWFVLRFRAIFYTVVLILTLITVLVLLVFGSTLQKAAIRYVPIISHFMSVLIGIRIIIIMGVLIFFFAWIFKMVPNRKASFKSQLPGAILSAISWYVFSFGLSIYVEYFNGFSTYGSLATIVLVMLWLYFCMYILLLCAETNVVFSDLFHKWRAKLHEKRVGDKK